MGLAPCRADAQIEHTGGPPSSASSAWTRPHSATQRIEAYDKRLTHGHLRTHVIQCHVTGSDAMTLTHTYDKQPKRSIIMRRAATRWHRNSESMI